MSKTIEGKPLEYNIAAAVRYKRKVNKLIDAMAKDMRRRIIALLRSDDGIKYFSQDASISTESENLNDKLRKEYEKVFETSGKTIATSMVKDILKYSDKTLTTSLKEISKDLSIDFSKAVDRKTQEVIKASIHENAKLISSIQERYVEQVGNAVFRSISQGTGINDVISNVDFALKSQARIAKNRSKNIALDQTRKAYNNINKSRMQNIGITKFKWLHSGGGQQPRKLHQDKWPAGLNGGIFSFDDLPVIDEKTGERGIPSTLPNCKCRMVAVLEFDEE